MTGLSARTSAPIPLIGLAVLFVLVLGAIVAAPMVRARVAVYAPSGSRAPQSPASLVRDTVTIDARDGSRWQYFAFARGLLTAPDTAGWDLAFRRFNVRVAGAVADLGGLPFAEVAAAPDSGYVATPGRDSVNAAVARWYRYSFVSHLLEPKRHIYVVRGRDGRYAKLAFISYYCPGPAAGCLTFEYAFQGAGGRALR